ncbi:MAG: hypothetical protein ACXU9D_26250, partial [Xanthobacteraceae bacterium]
LTRQDGIHAAAVVIGAEPLMNTVPLQQKGPDQETVTQFDVAATLVRNCYGLSSCWPPVRIWPVSSQPTAPFTSRLSAVRSPSPLLDITTASTGLLCWRDLYGALLVKLDFRHCAPTFVHGISALWGASQPPPSGAAFTPWVV